MKKPLKNRWYQWFARPKTIEKPSSLLEKTIEKPLVPMVGQTKTIEKPSLPMVCQTKNHLYQWLLSNHSFNGTSEYKNLGVLQLQSQ